MDLKHLFGKIKEYGLKGSIEIVMHRFLFFPRNYYSELGEDILLQHYCSKKSGFYIDIGAYHPKKISVTYLFYQRGWRGINIEPNPQAIKTFNRMRRRDINLNIGIYDEVGKLDYYYYGKNDSNNTFNPIYEQQYVAKEIMKIKVDTLNNVLDNYLPEGTTIDFLNIDVEGDELKILQSIDYNKYAPKLILVEDLNFYDKNKDFMAFRDTALYKFLNMKGYIVVAKTWYTILFKKLE